MDQNGEHDADDNEQESKAHTVCNTRFSGKHPSGPNTGGVRLAAVLRNEASDASA